MEIPQRTAENSPNFCEWCMNIATSNCGNCHAAYYCCRDHQLAHWSIHKQICRKIRQSFPPVAVVNPMINNTQRIDNFAPQNSWCPNNLQMSRSETLNMPSPMGASNNFSSNPSLLVPEKPIEFQSPSVDEMFSSYEYSDFLSSANNFWNLFNAFDTQNVSSAEEDPEKDKAIAKISETLQETASAFLNQSDNQFPEDSTGLMQCASLQDICENIVRDLNSFGICVLDNFIGARQGTLILNEVKNLYYKGIFKKGELVTPNPFMSKENIRSDVTTWVNGTEPECTYIGNLMRKLDVVVTTCNKLKNNGVLSQYRLHRRTKAMIACYPGDGTYYKKHIDNPHKDGRCITCIYYLNKNWDAKEHGGLLRMFPVANNTQVANIEPIFDRMIFFWSDKRNPHEVLPAYQTRFAITVWYFDADERDRALMTFREQRARQCRA
ncbi:Egl nine 1 [Araneus ventricosus]|uniref:hypoxia-inducible factor-proline dioxygenase n=1 Tax=Araneus ventricosus TaxID=182803 RepID=A0A4Y2UM48_ARAVE|nr:Egl nine 1 [Araneus ventricosus]